MDIDIGMEFDTISTNKKTIITSYSIRTISTFDNGMYNEAFVQYLHIKTRGRQRMEGRTLFDISVYRNFDISIYHIIYRNFRYDIQAFDTTSAIVSGNATTVPAFVVQPHQAARSAEVRTLCGY